MACGYCNNGAHDRCEGGYYDLKGKWVPCNCGRCK